MRKLLVATHGRFASGIMETFKLIMGENDKISEISAYVEPGFDMKKEAEKKAEAESEYPAEITIDDFCKVQLKVGEVLESKEVEGSKKLLRNVVKLGDEERVIFSGIKDAYAPGELVGKRVVVAYNLKPRKMMGEMSYGMILCAEDGDGKLSVLTTDDKDFASGSSIS